MFATESQKYTQEDIASGINVYDVGLTVSPGAYFAQFFLDCKSVAMVTASHNKNVLDAEIKHSEFCISSTTEHFLWFSSFILQMFCVTVVSYDWQILWR